MKTTALLVILLAVAASCSDAPPGGEPTTPLTGYVHAGPICPVAQDPPDPQCADRPVAGAEMKVVDAAGTVVATATSAADGTFSVLVPAGSLTLEPQPVDGLMGTAAPQSVQVGTDPVHLDVAYDTGIR